MHVPFPHHERRWKPGDLVLIKSTREDITLPIARNTSSGGFKALKDIDNIGDDFPHWQGILANQQQQRLFVDIPKNQSVIGLVIEYEDLSDIFTVDQDSFEHNDNWVFDRRLFVMVSLGGEPEYVQILENAEYVREITNET